MVRTASALRAAIYARVSSELQDTQNSLARQLAACKAWGTANDAEISDEHIYCDEAVSGVSLLARPALQRLLQQLGRRGSPPWDVVLVDDDSRLDRGGHLAELCARFSARGVRLVAVDSGRDLTHEDERLLVHVKAGLNEHYISELARRTRAGMAQRVIQGWHGGGTIYGYRLVPEWPAGLPPEQRSRDNRLGTRVEIDEVEAAIVREIFQRYAEGDGLKAITKDLNERGISSPRKETWDQTGVRALLLIKKYAGDWTWNTSRWRKRPEALLSDEERERVRRTGRHPRQRVERPESEHVRLQREDLRIVEEDVWEVVAQAFERRKGQRGKRPAQSPLAGLMVCECGGSIARHAYYRGRPRLGCSFARNRGTCMNVRTLDEGEVIATIAAYLLDDLLTAEGVEAAVTAAHTKLRQLAARQSDPAELREAEAAVAALRESCENLVDAIEAGADVLLIRDRLREKQAELDLATQELEALRSPPVEHMPKTATPEQIHARVEQLREALRAEDSALIRRALRAVIVRITVHPIDGDWLNGWDLEIATAPWADRFSIFGSGGGIPRKDTATLAVEIAA